MTSVQVRLFGKVSVSRDGRPVSALSTKALELLCYLLLFRERAHAREALSDLLWPGASESLSKKYLRQTLWQLRTRLNGIGDARTGAESMLGSGSRWVRINPEAGWWLDVEAFERAYGGCREVAGENLSELQARTLAEATVLYRGDLIESWYQDWCIYERDRLLLIQLAMLEKLMAYCEANLSFANAVEYGNSILRLDPAREVTHRGLMRLHYRVGDRGGALRQFERCVAVLNKQYGLRPSAETVALHQQLRAGDLEPATSVSSERLTTDVGSARDLLLDVRRQLNELRQGMAALQRQVAELTLLSRLARNGADGHRDALQDGGRYNGS